MDTREQAQAAYRNYRIWRLNETVGHKYSHKAVAGIPQSLADAVWKAADGEINPAYITKFFRKCMSTGKMAQLKKYSAWKASRE